MADANPPTEKMTHVCPHQGAFFLDNWFRRWLQPPRKIIGPYINEGDTVVDMGCGPGFFTIDMAKTVGPRGKVFAVDLQLKMLSHVRKKANNHSVVDRIVFHQCQRDHIGLRIKANFILAYYMVHEIPDPKRLFEELKEMLHGEGTILVVEPKMHVSKATFEDMLSVGRSIGLTAVDFPKSKGGRCVRFGR